MAFLSRKHSLPYYITSLINSQKRTKLGNKSNKLMKIFFKTAGIVNE